MSEIDLIKEAINYLKLWLGITIVTIISLCGWLFSNYETTAGLLFWGAVFIIAALIGVCFIMHRNIESKIESLRRL